MSPNKVLAGRLRALELLHFNQYQKEGLASLDEFLLSDCWRNHMPVGEQTPPR